MNILEELANSAREIVKNKKQKVSEETLKEDAYALRSERFKFEKALSEPGISFICELKKASPSKGLIREDFNYLDFAKDYETSGASAISCLTEPTKFLGSLEYLKNTSEAVDLPVLRKDFIVEPYQIYEAKINGASAILLIVALLTQEELFDYITIADDLGLSALVEVHNEKELEKALKANARIIGVNNRDLRDFSVDLKTTEELSKLIPDDVLFVSESGIHSYEDVKRLEKTGVDAVLIGEQLMRSDDIPAALKELKYGN